MAAETLGLSKALSRPLCQSQHAGRRLGPSLGPPWQTHSRLHWAEMLQSGRLMTGSLGIRDGLETSNGSRLTGSKGGLSQPPFLLSISLTASHPIDPGGASNCVSQGELS